MNKNKRMMKLMIKKNLLNLYTPIYNKTSLVEDRN